MAHTGDFDALVRNLPGQDLAGILSGKEVEEEVHDVEHDAGHAIDAAEVERKSTSIQDRLGEAEDNPGGNTFDNILRGLGTSTNRRIEDPETFEEFFQRTTPATQMLAAGVRGAFQASLGQKVTSCRRF